MIDCLGKMEINGETTFEADPAAEELWVEHVNEVASMTLFPKGGSWYLGANIPGKPRQFLGHLMGSQYFKRLTEVADTGYEGFTTEAVRFR